MTHFSALVVTAIKKRVWTCYILWQALCLVDGGQGHIAPEGITKAQTSLGWTSRKLRRVLGKGTNTFWRAGKSADLFLGSTARIAFMIGANLGCPFGIARTKITGARGQAYAAMRAFGVERQGYPVTVAHMADRLGKTTRTVKTWKQRSGLQPRPNFALVAPVTPGTSVQAIARVTRQNGLRTAMFRGRRWIVRQIGDSLPHVGRGSREVTKRQSRQLRRLRGRVASGHVGGGNTPTRRRPLDSPPRFYAPRGHEDSTMARLWEPISPTRDFTPSTVGYPLGFGHAVGSKREASWGFRSCLR